MARETVTFEKIAPKGGDSVYAIPQGYDGLDWGQWGVATDKTLRGHPGLAAALDGHALAVDPFGDEYGHQTIFVNSGSFRLVDGHFSSAMAGLKVTFTAYTGTEFTVIGSQTVTLDDSDTLVRFSKIFKNVTGVSIDLDQHTDQAVFSLDDLRVDLFGAGAGAAGDSGAGVHAGLGASHPGTSYPPVTGASEDGAYRHEPVVPHTYEGAAHDDYFLV